MNAQFWQWFFLVVVLLLGFTVFTGAPYVPSLKKELRLAFKKLYPLGKKDFLLDLGSGDGVVLKVAQEFGASGLGIELNPLLASIAKLRLAKYSKVKIKTGDLFKCDFPKQTTVVYLFGNSRDLSRMVEKIQAQTNCLQKPLFVISNAFTIEGRKAKKQYRSFFLYEFLPLNSASSN